MGSRTASVDGGEPVDGDHKGELESSERAHADVPEQIPSEVVEAVNKTVGYVSKHGPSFEERLCANGDTTFGFVKPGHVYHQYYRDCLEKAVAPVKEETAAEMAEVPIEVPPPLYFHTPLPPVSAVDLEVIKHTALAVAANSEHKNYLEKLVVHQQEQGNHAQFEFTVKSHSLNPLFNRYIEQYLILLQYLKEGDERIRSRIDNEPPLFERAHKRALYIRQERATHKRQQRDREQEMRRYASIDWQKFSMMGMIEFDAIDEVREMPPPMKRSDLLYRSLKAKAKTEAKPERKEKASQSPVPETATVKPEIDETAPGALRRKGMKIKAAGLSRLKAAENKTLTCPLTGKQIPEPEFDGHLRTLLRDPRYQQQQDNYMRKNFANASSLSTAQVFENIQRLVRKRSAPEPDHETKRKA